jgi:uncharacterized membrane protein YraQ (UPF0718 family)
MNAIRFVIGALPEMMFLFIGVSFIVGVLNEFIPEERFRAALSAGHARGYLAGAAMGALTPFCSCSTVPIVIGLLKARTGFGPTMTFLFTSPLLNPIIAALFVMNFGMGITSAYAGLVLIFSVFAGWVLERLGMSRYIEGWVLAGKSGGGGCCGCDKQEDSVSIGENSIWTRLGNVFRNSIRLFFSFLPYMILGLGIGGFMHDFVPSDWITRWTGANNPLGIPLAAIVGVPLYVRVSAMIPISPVLLAKGMSIGAFVALVIGGAGASLPEAIMLKRIFKWKLLLFFLGSVFVMATLGGILFEFLL